MNVITVCEVRWPGCAKPDTGHYEMALFIINTARPLGVYVCLCLDVDLGSSTTCIYIYPRFKFSPSQVVAKYIAQQ